MIGTREGESGSSVKVVCAKHNISEATFDAWEALVRGMAMAAAAAGLGEENARLKRLVADLAVQIQILKEVNSKKW